MPGSSYRTLLSAPGKRVSHRGLDLTSMITLPLLGLWACGGPEEPNIISGYIEAEYIYVAPSRSGWITHQSGTEGDAISPGDLLFTLDRDREELLLAEAQARRERAGRLLADSEQGARPEEIAVLQAGLQEARAQLEFAGAERERWEKTAAQDLASRSRADAAIAEQRTAQAKVLGMQGRIEVARLAARDNQVQAARAELEAATAVAAAAQWELDQRRVVAGSGGVIDEIYYRTGEYVQAGQPVVSLLLPDTRKVRFFVPQARLPQIGLGDTVSVRIDGVGEPVTARISHIGADAEFTPPVLYGREARDKLVFLIEAEVAADVNLNPGQPVDVLLP